MNSSKCNLSINFVIVNVSANAAAFYGTIVHQVSLRQTVSICRRVEVDKMLSHVFSEVKGPGKLFKKFFSRSWKVFENPIES